MGINWPFTRVPSALLQVWLPFGRPLVLVQWVGAGGLDLNLKLQAAHDGVAQKKAEKSGNSLSMVQGEKEERKLEGGLGTNDGRARADFTVRGFQSSREAYCRGKTCNPSEWSRREELSLTAIKWFGPPCPSVSSLQSGAFCLHGRHRRAGLQTPRPRGGLHVA
jgi:hypothetical protein